MGIKIQTDGKPVKVWRSDKLGFPTYYLTISKKEGDHYIKDYQDIMFRTGVELENGTEIYIHNAFPTLATWVNDNGQRKKKVWMILNFSLANEAVKPRQDEEVYEGWEDIP